MRNQFHALTLKSGLIKLMLRGLFGRYSYLKYRRYHSSCLNMLMQLGTRLLLTTEIPSLVKCVAKYNVNKAVHRSYRFVLAL